MTLRIFAPSQLLAPYVEAFWDYEDLTGDENSTLSILPDTASYLCFLYQDPLQTTHRHGSYSTRSGLAGFQSFRNDLGGNGRISGVSARLTAWGLSAFHQGIAKDCAERRVDCRDIFPKHTVERIEDDLGHMGSVEERVRYIENFLLSILNSRKEDRLIQTASRIILQARGNCQISKLAHHVGLSKRTLERRFFNQIGATPKKFARVIRLRHAILQRPFFSSWAEVALEVGYFDQSHMIHDFMDLYGFAPEAIYPHVLASPTIQFSGLLNLNPVH
ncbi:MAG: helix-turn-helix transcriptional regulator [Methylophilus sp.]|nr:helix-turn-helix transcriptional regulator [Methylophilus sp.]